ncbi:hypothetical protein [Gilliamella sp. CG33]|uniref:hypothetical protein n=1 Tax=Gilliamella sp. CG33 TaxID=3351506 RepID=UPI00398739E9
MKKVRLFIISLTFSTLTTKLMAMRRGRKRRRPGPYRGRAFRRPRIVGPQRFYTRGRRATAGGELKFHDISFSDAVVTNSGAIVEDSLLTIAQGTTESTRIGRKLTVKAIAFRYTVQIPTTATAANTTDTIRVMMYLDKQTNGAAAAVTDILESAAYQSFNQLANTSRFTILYDKTTSLSCKSGSGRGTADTLSFGGHRVDPTFYKTCNIPIEYDNVASTGVITTMRSNNIGILAITASGLAGIPTALVRIRFSDN